MPTELPLQRLNTRQQPKPVGLALTIICLSGLLCSLALARVDKTATDEVAANGAMLAEPPPSAFLAP
jgi:hypothetical protein